MQQRGSFDRSDREELLEKLGGSPPAIDQVVDWDGCRATLEQM